MIVTFEEAAKDPSCLPYVPGAFEDGLCRIGVLRAADGSACSWDIVKRDDGYVLQLTLVEGEDDGKGGHAELDETACEPVLFVPVEEASPALAEALGNDYVPTTYASEPEAYAAFLEVVYATDDESELVRVRLANETSASAYDYDVSRAVAALLARTSEEDLARAMPPVPVGWTAEEEGESYREALEDFAVCSGLPEKVVIVESAETPTFWFCSGWASHPVCRCEGEQSAENMPEPPASEDVPEFPEAVSYDIEPFDVSHVRSEGDLCQAISDKLLPDGFEVWGFGLCRCQGKLLVSVAAAGKEEDNIEPETTWFGTYVIDEDEHMLRRLGVGWTEEGLLSFTDGHKIEWIPELWETESALQRVFGKTDATGTKPVSS